MREVGLFPEVVAGPALPRATKAAWRELKTELPDKPREALRMLRKRLMPIVAKYVREREFHALPSPKIYRQGFEQLAGHAEQLLADLGSLVPDARGQLNRAMRSGSVEWEAFEASTRSPLDAVSQVLNALVKRSRACAADDYDSGTKRKNTHIQYGAQQLRSLWCELSGKEWAKNYDSESGKADKEEFVSPRA